MKPNREDKFILSLIGIAGGGVICAFVNMGVGFIIIWVFSISALCFVGYKKKK